ncbi:hypothetical protein TUM12370_37620 [Salmonella enterica subsp. enterica serovar Choleraesuis]|nr:hypothetical protein TUM12370_37620 [Salmonella enterica subsp. enterica serovar Choleraesuis]
MDNRPDARTLCVRKPGVISWNTSGWVRWNAITCAVSVARHLTHDNLATIAMALRYRERPKPQYAAKVVPGYLIPAAEI